MSLKRRASSLVAVISVFAALAIGAPSANAVSLDQVKGGQSSLFVPFSQVQEFARAGVFVSPISPAFLTFNSFQEGPALRFPISGGAVESATMLGSVNHDGGMLIQKYNPDGTLATELEVTQVKIVGGVSLVGNALGLVPAPTADLVNASHSKNQATGVIHYEADARINEVNSIVLNTYFSTDVFKPGLILGRLKSDIQTKKLIGL
jgi:hypothetical protein